MQIEKLDAPDNPLPLRRGKARVGVDKMNSFWSPLRSNSCIEMLIDNC